MGTTTAGGIEWPERTDIGAPWTDLAPGTRAKVLEWLRANEYEETARDLERPDTPATWEVRVTPDCVFGRLNGISCEPALAWKEAGAWTCETELARSIVRETTGLDARIG